MQQLEHGSHGSTTLALMISHLVSGISQQKRLLYCLDYLKTLRRREVFVRSSKDGFLYDHPRFLRVKNGSPTFPDSVSTGSTKKTPVDIHLDFYIELFQAIFEENHVQNSFANCFFKA